MLAGVLKLKLQQREWLTSTWILELNLDKNCIAETHSLISKPKQKRQESRRVKRKEKKSQLVLLPCSIA
jgi:hypothetical protein